MHIDAGLRASGARLRAAIEELFGPDVLGTLMQLGVVTTDDLRQWEREDLRVFAARMRREEARR